MLFPHKNVNYSNRQIFTFSHEWRSRSDAEKTHLNSLNGSTAVFGERKSKSADEKSMITRLRTNLHQSHYNRHSRQTKTNEWNHIGAGE